MKNVWRIKKTLGDQIDEYGERTRYAGGDLDNLHKLSDTYKNFCKIDILEDEEEGGEYSHARRRRDMRGRYSRDGDRYSYDEDGDSYGDGMRGNMGGGNYARRYSRADGKERMMEILEGMRDGVQGPEKQTVERMIDMLHKL